MFRNGKYDIRFLLETYSNVKDETIWKNEFGGRVMFVHCTNNGAGMMILLKNGFDINIIDTFSSTDGRSVILKTEIEDECYYFVCLYAPNNENAQIKFYDKLLLNMQTFGIIIEDKIIIGGDFNVVLSEKDKKGGHLKLKKKVINNINKINLWFSLQDIFGDLKIIMYSNSLGGKKASCSV